MYISLAVLVFVWSSSPSPSFPLGTGVRRRGGREVRDAAQSGRLTIVWFIVISPSFMSLFSVTPDGPPLHIGAGSEYIAAKVLELEQKRGLDIATIEITGHRASDLQARAMLPKPGSKFASPRYDYSESSEGRHEIRRIYELQTGIHRRGKEIILEFLGNQKMVGDVKIAFNGTDEAGQAELFLTASPRIPFATDVVYQRILQEIHGSGEGGSHLRVIIEDWIEEHPEA